MLPVSAMAINKETRQYWRTKKIVLTNSIRQFRWRQINDFSSWPENYARFCIWNNEGTKLNTSDCRLKITVNHLCSDFLHFIVDTHIDFDESRPMWCWEQIRGSSHFWCAMENPSTCVYKGPGKQGIEN